VRWGQALFLSSISAWVFYIVYALLAAGFETYWQACGRAGMLAFTLALAILGFPIALVICLLIGGPALWAAELLKLTKWRQAALLGALGGILALLLAPMRLGPAVGFEFDLRTVLSLAVLSPAGACAGVAAWGSLWLDGKYRREAVKGGLSVKRTGRRLSIGLPFLMDGFRMCWQVRVSLLPIVTAACHRDGNEGFSQGKSRALSECAEADQVRRGVLNAVA
jgi:hypothetical protein